MLASSLTFLAPAGALLCLTALAPLAAVLLSEMRSRHVVRALGLGPGPIRGTVLRGAALAVACVLLGLAVARPVLRTAETSEARTDAQAYFVLDVSRSMLASRGSSSPTRLERAKEAALRLYAEVQSVPSGVAGLTDRVLPYALPTTDQRVFAAVVERSVAVNAPPPRDVQSVATAFAALADLQRRSFFPAAAKVRLCVVLTDGESRAFSSAQVGSALLSSPPCRLVVVRFGDTAERIYGDDARVEAQYRPRAEAGAAVDALVSGARGSEFTEAELDSAARRLRSLAGSGPTRRVTVETTTDELAPFLALAASALVLLVVLLPLVLEHFVAFAQRVWIASRARA
jgi:hypothetical protein